AEPWYATYARTNRLNRNSAHGQKPGVESPNLDLVFPITYYPNATDASGAATIRVEAGSAARADMRLVPVPAVHMRMEMGEADPNTWTQVIVAQKVLGSYQEQSGVSTQEVETAHASSDGEDDRAAESSGPLVLELDGLRPGASVLHITTGDSRQSGKP